MLKKVEARREGAAETAKVERDWCERGRDRRENAVADGCECECECECVGAW